MNSQKADVLRYLAILFLRFSYVFLSTDGNLGIRRKVRIFSRTLSEGVTHCIPVLETAIILSLLRGLQACYNCDELERHGGDMEKLSTDEIISYLKRNKALLNERFGVTRIGIFGSFARGDQLVTSDIDMVVEMEKARKNIHSFLKLKRFLEQEMSREIDLGFENSIKPAIKEKVIKQIIYA